MKDGVSLMQIRDEDQLKLYNLYYDKVFGYLASRLNNRADAEDLTSEVFLKLYSKGGEIDPDKKGVASYVFKVMRSVFADFHRRNRASFAQIGEVAFFDDVDADETLESLDRALETLPLREQTVVILHYYDGLSHKEIAQKMGLSHTNVRQISHTAIKKLRKVMVDDYKEKIAVGDEDLAGVDGGFDFYSDEIEDTRKRGACNI